MCNLFFFFIYMVMVFRVTKFLVLLWPSYPKERKIIYRSELPIFFNRIFFHNLESIQWVWNCFKLTIWFDIGAYRPLLIPLQTLWLVIAWWGNNGRLLRKIMIKSILLIGLSGSPFSNFVLTKTFAWSKENSKYWSVESFSSQNVYIKSG